MSDLLFYSGGTSATIGETISGSVMLSETPVFDGMRIDTTLYATDFASETIAALKKALGYGDVVVKCGHCGQWGAVKTECKKCGAPVD